MITFKCSIPTIANAIKIHGEDGTRIILDIPETESKGKRDALSDLRGKLLTVRIETTEE